MLKKIVIKNINSIDVCEIDFSKGNYKFAEENVLSNTVNPIVIYGYNGSGKSSVMNAFQQFISMMIFPLEALTPFIVNNFLYEDYLISHDEDLIKGSIELFFDLNSKTYDYFLETSRNNYISNEYLKVDGEVYFKNSNGKYLFQGKDYIPESKGISKLVPFLRILASSEITNSTIQTVHTYIKSFTTVNVAYINRGGFVTSSLFNNTNTFDLIASKSPEVKEILKNYNTFPVYSVVKDDKLLPNGYMQSQYNVILEDKNFERKLPYQMVSNGMQNQSILLSLILSMPKESVLFIDEVDIALHPSTIKSFLEVIRQKKIQVVLTLHNTYAMQFLRPDQIYLSKWSQGFSHYYRLSKIYPNIREVNNIERMYLSMLFDGAINDSKK